MNLEKKKKLPLANTRAFCNDEGSVGESEQPSTAGRMFLVKNTVQMKNLVPTGKTLEAEPEEETQSPVDYFASVMGVKDGGMNPV